MFKIHDLLSCDRIEDQWVELDKCKSGEIMFSSKVTRREIRESLTVMVISSVHDHDKNYDHDVDDDIGNVDGASGYTGSDDHIECCSQSAECGVRELAHHFTRGFR